MQGSGGEGVGGGGQFPNSWFSDIRMARPGVRQVQEDSGEQGRMEETGCEIICGVPTTLAVKG